MPLYKTINFSSSTQILVWKITESFDELFGGVQLNEKSYSRLTGMKSQLHQRAFLSVRKLLQEIGYSDYDLFYDEFGKPHLNDGNHVSITHSHEFSAIIVSNQIVGIDMELRREKIKIIADKFINYEFHFLNKNDNENYISKLTVIWGIKEAIFKIRNEPGISFKNNIKVISFDINSNQARAWLQMANVKEAFLVYFEEIENFILVYAFENH